VIQLVGLIIVCTLVWSSIALFAVEAFRSLP
jgi:hypothetical protein